LIMVPVGYVRFAVDYVMYVHVMYEVRYVRTWYGTDRKVPGTEVSSTRIQNGAKPLCVGSGAMRWIANVRRLQ
jgi:hypothetical protein